ncbi:MAG: hypothetical protein WCW65_02650 [Candidatus Paceibacterota bacterium]
MNQKEAEKYIDDYIDMGCFKNAAEARPYLIDGFMLGIKYNERQMYDLLKYKEQWEDHTKITNAVVEDVMGRKVEEAEERGRKQILDFIPEGWAMPLGFAQMLAGYGKEKIK